MTELDMDWIEIDPNDDYTYPPEGYSVIASDGVYNCVLYYLRSGEYVWMQSDEDEDCSDEFKDFVPTKWYMLPQFLEVGTTVICIKDRTDVKRGEVYELTMISNIDRKFATGHPKVYVKNNGTIKVGFLGDFVDLAESRSQTIRNIVNA